MAKGDHLYKSFFFDGFPVTHHAIDCGNGNVIEFQGYFEGGKVEMISLDKFKKGKTVYTKTYEKCDSPDTVVERAYRLLGQQGYCLFTNNCEHLAYFCKTGIKQSGQVKNLLVAIGSTAGGVVGMVTAGLISSAMSAHVFLGLGTAFAAYQFGKTLVLANK